MLELFLEVVLFEGVFKYRYPFKNSVRKKPLTFPPA
jgi:hypothetical protein